MLTRELPSIFVILVLFCPGIAFVFFSSLLQHGRAPAITKDTVGGMIAVSLVYVVVLWLLGVVPTSFLLHPNSPFIMRSNWCQLVPTGALTSLLAKFCEPSIWQRSGIVFFFMVVPALFGVLWGEAIRSDRHLRMMRRMGLNPADSSATAWGMAFSTIEYGAFVVVTLKDGTIVSGNLVSGSAISSDAGFRDIFISETERPEGHPQDLMRGTWISPDEIRTIELVTKRKS